MKKNQGNKLYIFGRSRSLSLSTKGKVVCDNLQGHTFSLRDLHVNKDPRDNANRTVDDEHTNESDRAEKNRKRVSDDNVSDPEHHSADSNAETTDSRWEDFRTEDVRNGTVTHHEEAEVEYHTGRGERCVYNFADVDKLADD